MPVLACSTLTITDIVVNRRDYVFHIYSSLHHHCCREVLFRSSCPPESFETPSNGRSKLAPICFLVHSFWFFPIFHFFSYFSLFLFLLFSFFRLFLTWILILARFSILAQFSLDELVMHWWLFCILYILPL